MRKNLSYEKIELLDLERASYHALLIEISCWERNTRNLKDLLFELSRSERNQGFKYLHFIWAFMIKRLQAMGSNYPPVLAALEEKGGGHL